MSLSPGASVAGPRSGVHLGIGVGGPVSLRLFRLTGTTITVGATILPTQLIAVRAAAAGTPVQVVTSRPQFWEPLLPTGRSRSYLVTATEQHQPSGGPSLIIDDRPAQARRAPTETQPWQCRIDVRSDWANGDLSSFVYADLAVIGAIPPNLTRAAAAAFRLPGEQVDRLTHLEPGSVAILRRSRLDVVALDPAPAERAVLDAARGSAALGGRQAANQPPPPPAAPIWR